MKKKKKILDINNRWEEREENERNKNNSRNNNKEKKNNTSRENVCRELKVAFIKFVVFNRRKCYFYLSSSYTTLNLMPTLELNHFLLRSSHGKFIPFISVHLSICVTLSLFLSIGVRLA